MLVIADDDDDNGGAVGDKEVATRGGALVTAGLTGTGIRDGVLEVVDDECDGGHGAK